MRNVRRWTPWIAGLAVLGLLACAGPQAKTSGKPLKVKCPVCGTEFEAKPDGG
ncbi:hypothetical protein [Deferrisoma palaeochoriense]